MPKLRYMGRDRDGRPVWVENREDGRKHGRWEEEDEPMSKKVLRGYYQREQAGGRSVFPADFVKRVWEE